jgi:two-component system NtrC family sensor kinase
MTPAVPKTGRPSRTVIMLFTAAVLVPALLFGLAAWNDYRQALQRAERDVQRTVATLAEHATKVFETQDMIFDRIAERIAGQDWDEISASEPELHPYLKRMNDDLPQVSNILLIDERGRPRVNAIGAPAPQNDLSDRAYFTEQQSTSGGTFIDKVVKGRLAGALSFYASRHLSRPDGSFGGVIAIGMTPDYFAEFWRSFTPFKDHFVGLVRADGEVLARHPALGRSRSDCLSTFP